MIKSNEEKIYIILACIVLFQLFLIDPQLYLAAVIAISLSEIGLMGADHFYHIMGKI